MMMQGYNEGYYDAVVGGANGIKARYDQLEQQWNGKKVEVKSVTDWGYGELLFGRSSMQLVSGQTSLLEMENISQRARIISNDVRQLQDYLSNFYDPQEAAEYAETGYLQAAYSGFWNYLSPPETASYKAYVQMQKLNQEIPISSQLLPEVDETYEKLQERILEEKKNRFEQALHKDFTPQREANGVFYHEQQSYYSGTCGIHALNAFAGEPKYDELSIARANHNIAPLFLGIREFEENANFDPKEGNDPAYVHRTLLQNGIQTDHEQINRNLPIAQKWEAKDRVIICDINQAHFTCARKATNGRWHFIDSLKTEQPSYNTLDDLINAEFPNVQRMDLIA